ncbi:MAG: lipase family protein [Magnetospirillum sp. WYHS-4]
MGKATVPAALLAESADLDAAALAFLARRAQVVYKTEAEIAGALARAGGRLVGFIDEGGCEVFVARFGESEGCTFTVVAFRGTEPRQEPADIVADLDVRRESLSMGLIEGDGESHKVKVHAGFQRGVDAVATRLGRLLDAAYRLGPVYGCGHSKGGAETVLAAALWPWIFRAIATFGAPRCLNAEGAAAFRRHSSTRHYRVVNRCDMVPLVPPALTGWCHDREAVYIDGDGGIHWGLGAGSEWMLRSLDYRPGRGVLDHYVDRYIEALDKAAADG